ncbi:MAG: 30S ribosomal protein S5 [Phycisphaeraceae bacterium]|nr:30S ribosomal protein S5 [Phycisphaeraceae bacterium]
MAELLDEASHLESTTINVSRTAATVKGGRRFSFNALVVVGDRRGRVGYGYGKANEVPPAIEKAQKEAKKDMQKVELFGGTIPHQVQGRFGASQVRLIPASPGTGVVAGAAVRAVLEMVGVTDCLTKSFGSTNPQNIIKATFAALEQLQPKEAFAALRGVDIGDTEVEQKVEKGKAFMRTSSFGTAEKAKAPVNTVGQDRRGGPGGRGGRGGRPGGPGGGRGRRPEGDGAPAGESGGGDAPAASN